MNESEFRRRIEVYIERDLPDLAPERQRIADVLTHHVWVERMRWFTLAQERGEFLDWLDKEVLAPCPRCSSVIGELKFAQSGGGGPLSQYSRPD